MLSSRKVTRSTKQRSRKYFGLCSQVDGLNFLYSCLVSDTKIIHQERNCELAAPLYRMLEYVLFFFLITDAPLIKCLCAEATPGDRNVHIDCEVKSRPGLSALFWIIDVNGTTVAEGEVINEYWTLVRVGETESLRRSIWCPQSTRLGDGEFSVCSKTVQRRLVKVGLT